MNEGFSFFPCLYFFHTLRKQGFVLSLDEYDTFIQVIDKHPELQQLSNLRKDWHTSILLNVDKGKDIDSVKSSIRKNYEKSLSNFNALLPQDQKTGIRRRINALFSNKSTTKDILWKLCTLIWYKPYQSRELFDSLFETSWDKEINDKILKIKATLEGLKEEKSKIGKELPNDEHSSDSNHEETTQENTEVNSTDEDTDHEPEVDNNVIQKSIEEDLFINLSQNATNANGGVNTKGFSNGDPLMYRMLGAYKPISERDISFGWRSLREVSNTISTQEIDIQSMIDSYSRKGLFEIFYSQKAKFDTEILFLIDHDGSMVAFEDFAENLVSLAHKELSIVSTPKLPAKLYFRNIPSDYLYKDKKDHEPIPLKELIHRYSYRKIKLVIISDAGAARGTKSKERILYTESSLKYLKKIGNPVIWLNPMPQHRWYNTSAEYISKHLITMYPATKKGFTSIIKSLKGGVYEFTK